VYLSYLKGPKTKDQIKIKRKRKNTRIVKRFKQGGTNVGVVLGQLGSSIILHINIQSWPEEENL